MNRRLRHLLTLLCLLLAAASAHPAAAQPWLPSRGICRDGCKCGCEDDNDASDRKGVICQSDAPYQLLPTPELLVSLREKHALFAEMRSYQERYREEVESGDYARALALSDSLIRTVERHPVRGVRFTHCYENRARMLKALGRDAMACLAYDRAVRVRDSVLRLEQNQSLRELQASCELDRLSLDRTLLRAGHHKKTLIALSLLLAAVLTVVGIIFAVNRRTKRLHDELLRQMDHARRSEEKKIAFINSMCHEVRTPLNSIAGFAELLCTDDLTLEAHAQYCEIIQQSRRQLRYLFDDMLEVAYLENLHEPLPHGYLNLCAVCHAQMRSQKICHPRPGVAYVERIPQEEIGINTNGKYLEILLAALLNNAVKFTQKGSVTLACDRAGDDRVTITVTDTGCGIPPAQHDYVFERFVKLDPFSPGNGLGLYLCRLIVRHLGGEIRIDGDYTDGTRIVATLPRKPRTK